MRLIRQAPLPLSSTVRVLGVDAWAWRKGQSYGTILVDLEHQVPIDLLEDATAESFATWLKKHPTIEVISRDRGTTEARWSGQRGSTGDSGRQSLASFAQPW